MGQGGRSEERKEEGRGALKDVGNEAIGQERGGGGGHNLEASQLSARTVSAH